MNNEFLATLNMAAFFLPALILVLTFRGFFRALIAKWSGDNTAYTEGYMTLNPVAHIDMFGLFVIIIVLFVLGGLFTSGISLPILIIAIIFMGVRWSYEVPVREEYLKNHKLGMIFISLSGFIGNMVLALILLYMRKYFPYDYLPPYAIQPTLSLFAITIDLSLFLGLFNLLPIPPFDGSILLSYLLPASSYNIMQKLQEYSLFILIGLILFGNYIFQWLAKMAFLIEKLLMYLVI